MRLTLYILCIGFLSSCSEDTKPNAGEEVIASFGQRKLYKSNFADLYRSNISEEERNIILKGYISNWVKEQLMLDEAEKRLPKDFNIDKLVQDYRSSLVLNHYENLLVEELLDTIVSIDQKKDFYEKYKDDFLLAESIMRGVVIRLPKNKHEKPVKSMLEKNQLELLEAYILRNKGLALKDTLSWLAFSDFRKIVPQKVMSQDKLSSNGIKYKSLEDYEYFVKVLDFVSEGSIPPLNYIDGKLRQIILNNRKKVLISRKKQQLYDQNYASSDIKINIK